MCPIFSSQANLERTINLYRTYVTPESRHIIIWFLSSLLYQIEKVRSVCWHLRFKCGQSYRKGDLGLVFSYILVHIVALICMLSHIEH